MYSFIPFKQLHRNASIQHDDPQLEKTVFNKELPKAETIEAKELDRQIEK